MKEKIKLFLESKAKELLSTKNKLVNKKDKKED